MNKKVIFTPNAPDPIGPYNQAILAGNTLYISGQIAINPLTGSLISGNIEHETQQVLDNLTAILKEANFDIRNIVKTSIFISNMEDFNTINNIYAKYFNFNDAPARETVAVKTLPKNVNIEISAIAVK